MSEDEKWKLLDEIGVRLTRQIERANYLLPEDHKNFLLGTKDLVNQLKSLMIKEVRIICPHT